jgi:catechol 2,3-dioxygenase
MTVKVQKVGHVVLRVESLPRSLDFYSSVLGLREVARRDFGEGPMVFLTSGDTHHDLALVETRQRNGPGSLHHIALKVGESVQTLADVRSTVEAASVPVHMALDHQVSQGLYVSDPDGNLIELYVDADPLIWQADPSRVANSDPLAI